MTQQQIVTATEGTPLSTTIANFVALGLTCDNLSSSWVFLPDAGRFVPPWTASFTTPLVGTKSAVVQWQTPSGVSIPPSGTGKATLTFTDYIVPFSPGVVVTQAQPTSGSAATVSVQPPPNLTATPSSGFNLGVGSTATAVAGVAGQNIYVYGWLFSFVPDNPTAGQYFVGLKRTDGVEMDQKQYLLAGTGPYAAEPCVSNVTLPGVLKLPAGVGIVFDNSASSAGGINAGATIFYLQF